MMGYELCAFRDGEFAVDWSVVRRLIHSYQSARMQNSSFRTVKISESVWWNPFSWSMPEVEHIEINWEQLRADIERQTEAQLKRMKDCCYSTGMRNQARELLARVRKTRRLKEAFASRMHAVQRRNQKSINEAVEDYEGYVEATKFVRNTSAGTLMVGATFLSGGAAAAVIAGGTTLKGVAKFQDTGSLGAAGMEAAGTLVFSVIPIKHAKFAESLKGEVLLVVMEATWETGIGLVEGKAFVEAMGAGALKLTGPGVGRLFGSREVKGMLARATIPVKPNLRMGLSKLGVDVVSKSLGSVAQGQIEKRGGDYLSEAFKNRGSKSRPARPGDVANRVILDDEMLLKAAIVNMEKGIGRGW